MKNRVAAKALNTEKKLKKKAMRRWKKWKAAGEEKEKEEGEEGDWQAGSFEQLRQRIAEWDHSIGRCGHRPLPRLKHRRRKS